MKRTLITAMVGLALLHTFALLPSARADFVYADFGSITDLNLVGDAVQDGTALRLTRPAVFLAGDVWHTQQQKVVDGFESLFEFRITPSGYDADGIAFIIQNYSATVLGGNGGGKGYAGIPNCLAVEFDTYVDHEISIQTMGLLPNSPYGDARLASSGIPDLADGNVHTARVVYRAGTLAVYLDDLSTAKLVAAVNLATLLELNEGFAWVGLGAGTGEFYEKHEILSWKFGQLPEQPTDGLVGYYPLDGNAINALGTGNDGSCNGTVPAADRCGNPHSACELNGYADISFPSGPPLDPQGSFTYAFWMMSAQDYPVYTPSPCWLVDRTGETRPLVSLAIISEDYGTVQKGQFWFTPRANDWSQPLGGGSLGGGILGGTFMPQQWQHIAMVREYNTAYKLYVDGQLVGSGEDSGSPLTPPPLKLGRHAWNGFMGLVGRFDDLRIYNRALSAAEIAKLAADNGCGADIDPPVIACPPDVFAPTAPGLCSAVVEFSVTATDNSGNVNVVCSPASGSVFLKGATPVTCMATDASGNTASCVFTVTVHDNENPGMLCPADMTAGTDPGLCSALVDPGTPTVTDNCGATWAGARNDGLALTDPYSKGTTVIAWMATDEAGNTANGTQTITVEDRENPSITAPQDALVASDAGSCSATGVALGSPIASDNCEVVSIASDHLSTSFPLGETTVTWTVADGSGNTASAQQKVTVLASVGPTLLPPLAGQPVANKIRLGQVVPHKVTLADCSGAAVTAGVTVKLRVQGIDSLTGEVFQEVPEDAAGVGNDGTVTSDGIMVFSDGKYQFNLDTSNFTDPNTWASPTRYYRSTVTVIDNATLIVLGSISINLETR